jgi:Trk K+ transport system NAD-binding subunit
MLLRKFTSLRVKDYVELLKLNDDYEITVIKVKKGDWLENKKVSVLKLRQEGINLIGIERKNGTYVGTPSGDTTVTTEDKLILYGRERNLRNLEKRKQDVNGQQQHEQAMEQQKIEKERQKKKDKSVKK